MSSSIGRRELVLGASALAAAATALPQHTRAQNAPPVPKASDDPQYRTAVQLVEALQARKVSAVELLEQSLKRIETLDPHINAVVVRDFERARTAARAADEAIGRGERRPLLGVPMTVKESFDIAGLATTWGFPDFKDWKPADDAVTVKRLKQAGAVIMGKTNVPIALGDWQSYNAIYGVTNNPYDIARTPGGSSGGSAAALASGYGSLELGSDIGGSLRTPAHFTGVYSHKPTLDLIPQRGQNFPRAPSVPENSNGLSVVGPMARSARDLALALDVLAGPDEAGDGVAYKLALPAPRHQRLADFRILMIDAHPMAPVAESIRTALDRLAQRLEKSGAKVARSSPLVPDLGEATRNFMQLLTVVLNQARPPEYYEQLRAAGAELDPQSLDGIFLRSANMPWQEWRSADRTRIGYRQRWRAIFREFDAVLCPVMPTVAFPHDHRMPRGTRRLVIDNVQAPYSTNLAWVGFVTAAGLPATVAPVDRTQSGLPIGVQIIGPLLEDRTPIELAALMEREFGGFVPPVF